MSNEIFDVIALTLSSNEQNKDIRLAVYEALSAWLEHLKPTLGRHVKIDQLKEMLTKKPGDDEDILTVKLKCCLSIPYGNVSSKRRYSTDGNDLDARTSRSNSWSPDTLRKPPTPRNLSGQSPSDLRYLKLSLKKKHKISTSLYKKSLLNAIEKNYRTIRK